MVDALTASRATASSTLIPASLPVYKDVEATSFTYDPAKAAELLAASGYAGEEVKIITNKNYPIMYETGVLAQGFMRAIGINATIVVADFADYYSGDYNVRTRNYNPALVPTLIVDTFTGSKEAQASKLWTHPAARQVTNQLLDTPVAEQAPLYVKLHEMFTADAPMIVWATGEVTSGYKESVTGYQAWTGRLPRFWGIDNQ